MVADLESLVDVVGLERFALLGMSQGAAVAGYTTSAKVRSIRRK